MTILSYSPNVITNPPRSHTSPSFPSSLASLSIDSCKLENCTVDEQFVVLNAIGQGSFAEVRLARHVKDHLPKFVVKIIQKPQTPPGPETSTTKFTPDPHTEALCLKRAQGHPNIVRLHCVTTSDKHILLVQDYLQGGDMFDEIVHVWREKGGTPSNGGLDEATAVRYFVHLLDAVQHLHSLGIAHRDIKTENMLLSKDKSIMQLGDFGFATCSDVCYARCGTLDYIAPEVLTTRDNVYGFDPKKADIWSCAVVLFAMLTARLPFDAHTKIDTMHRIKTRTFEFPPNILSSEAEDLLSTVFLSNPTNRPSIFDLRNHHLIQKFPEVDNIRIANLGVAGHHHLLQHHHYAFELPTSVSSRTLHSN